MSVLAFKALSHGVERIPDSFFERIPGGYFTPAEKRQIDADRKQRKDRHQSEQRHRDSGRDRRRSRRERTPPTDYSDYSGHDTDVERESRRRDRRRRAKSLGRSPSQNLSRSSSRGRDHQRRRNVNGGSEDYGPMDRADRAERGPSFPPPPTSEYKPYNPQEYAPPGASATGAPAANGYQDPYDRRASSAMPDYGYPSQPPSHTAARYTPAAGYAPSPVNVQAPPPAAGYTPYSPADFASPIPDYRAPGTARAAAPPFYRQQSLSQPSLAPHPYPDNQAQLASYDQPPGRHGSTASAHHRRHRDGKRHRARSASHQGRSSSRVTDQVRDRFDNLDLQDKNLAASVGGALAGGLAGRAVGKGTLSTLIGAGIGAFGGREIEKRHEISKVARDGSRPAERSRSRHSGSRRERERGESRSPPREQRRNDRRDRRDRRGRDDSPGDYESDDYLQETRRRRR